MSAKEKILLIGGNGFVGKSLQECYKNDYIFKVYGSNQNILDAQNLKVAVEQFSPHHVINLASHVASVSRDYSETKLYDIALHGNLNIVKALEANQFNGTYLYVSSAEVYGYSLTRAHSESVALNPQNAYALSKAMAENLLKLKSPEVHFNIAIARPFNHIGIGQSNVSFLQQTMSNIATQVAKKTFPVKIEMSNPSSQRSYLDVRDVGHAYTVMLNCNKKFAIYNVCADKAFSLPSLLSSFMKKLNIEHEFLFTDEVKGDNTLLGVNTKIKQLGWNIEQDIIETLIAIHKVKLGEQSF